MALSLTIDGTDRVSLLIDGSLQITGVRDVFASRCDFMLKGTAASIIPNVSSSTVVIADGATTYFDGVNRSITLTEWKPGTFYCRCTAHDTVTPASDAIGPFSLSDVSGEDTYQQLWTSTSLGGWVSPAVFTPYCWWRLGEANGTTATDQRSTRNGTYVGSPTLGVTGALDNPDTAVTLDGSSQWVECGAYMLAGQTNFSIAAWGKTSYSGATQEFYGERTAAGTGAYVKFNLNTSGRPVFQYRDNAGTSDTITTTVGGPWNDGAWHHFVVTKSGTAIVIYVDGVSVKTGTLTANNTLSGTILARIGTDASGGYYWTGTIDEVMIWRSAIDTVMVRQMYAMRDVRPYVSLTIDAVHDTTTVTTATASTYDAGLAPGQYLTLTAANFGLHALEVQVQELTTVWQNATTPLYTVKIGDAPIKLAAAFP